MHSAVCASEVCFSRSRYTGKERDSESGLDMFGARYYGSSLGRFMTPDPLHIMKQKLVDPQQRNMYSYVRNNPLRFTDPTAFPSASDGNGVGPRTSRRRMTQKTGHGWFGATPLSEAFAGFPLQNIFGGQFREAEEDAGIAENGFRP
jgi:RHS repeat-associated protein